MGMILAIFDLQVTLILQTKLQVKWPFHSEVFDLPIASIFPASFKSVGLSVQEIKGNIDFQDGGHLGLPIGTVLAVFDLQIALIFPTKIFTFSFAKVVISILSSGYFRALYMCHFFFHLHVSPGDQ